MEMTRHQLSQSAREDYVYSGDTARQRAEITKLASIHNDDCSCASQQPHRRTGTHAERLTVSQGFCCLFSVFLGRDRDETDSCFRQVCPLA